MENLSKQDLIALKELHNDNNVVDNFRALGLTDVEIYLAAKHFEECMAGREGAWVID